jgi:hypothetical protein
MSYKNESDQCGGNDRPIKSSGSDFTPANITTPKQNLQDFQKLDSQFGRIEASFEAIASQHILKHRRLLALNWAARYHEIPAGTFQKAFEMWLESTEGGRANVCD